MKKVLLSLAGLVFTMAFSQQRKKDYSQIMYSKNIYEINAFLKDAHPNDPRRDILKPRLMEMIEEYIKNALPYDQRVEQLQEMLALLKKRPSTKISFDEMNAKIREKQIAALREQINEAGKRIKANSHELQFAPQQYEEGNTGKAALSTAQAMGINNYTFSEEAEFKELMSISAEEYKNKSVKLLNALFDNDPSRTDVVVTIENSSDCNLIMRIEGAGGKKYNLAVPFHQSNSILIDKGSYLFTSLVCGAQYASQKTIQKPIVVNLGNPK